MSIFSRYLKAFAVCYNSFHGCRCCLLPAIRRATVSTFVCTNFWMCVRVLDMPHSHGPWHLPKALVECSNNFQLAVPPAGSLYTDFSFEEAYFHEDPMLLFDRRNFVVEKKDFWPGSNASRSFAFEKFWELQAKHDLTQREHDDFTINYLIAQFSLKLLYMDINGRLENSWCEEFTFLIWWLIIMFIFPEWIIRNFAFYLLSAQKFYQWRRSSWPISAVKWSLGIALNGAERPSHTP